jgi:MoaA/NifB/PqqE/SkfB family radical SAM enzyme
MLDKKTIKKAIIDIAHLYERFHYLEYVEAIEFTGGGEPLTNPNFIYALDLCKDYDIKTALVTNGGLLTKRICDKVLECCEFIRISLDAGTEWTHDILHQPKRKDDYSRILKSIGYLAKNNKRNITVGIAFLVCPKNISEMYMTAKKMKKAGASYINFRPVNTDYELVRKRIGYSSDNFLITQQIQIQKQIDMAKTLEDEDFKVYGTFQKYRKKLQQHYFKKCRATPLNPVLGADGELYICCERRGEMSLGNIRDVDNLWDLWGTEKHQKIIESINLNECPKKCKYTQYNEIIERCFINNEMGWEFL